MNSMPTDLIVEIFSRLPAKSVAVCCCVSKLWASILNSQDFRELFLTRSSSRPRLLFAIQGTYNNIWRFFSSPQPHYSSDKSSHEVTADSYMKYLEDMRPYFCSYASGLMCFRQSRWIRKEMELYIVHVICNPSTGQYDLLPKLILNYFGDSTSFLGFDPVDRQFKVMFTDYNVQRIITLRSGELRWRNIQCSLPHQGPNEGICINGILYYSGFTGVSWPYSRILVCFDVRSEEFNFIEEEEVEECFNGFLINYKGKLGSVKTYYDGYTLQLRMWVLEDVEKQKRLEYVYNLPKNKFFGGTVSVVGMTARGEIVLISDYTYLVLYFYYFNPESNTLQILTIQGLCNFRISDVKVFVDYVVDLRFDVMKTSLPEQKSTTTSSTKKKKKRKTSSKDDDSVTLSPINTDVSFWRPMLMHVAVSSNVCFENLPKAWWYVSLLPLLVYLLSMY